MVDLYPHQLKALREVHNGCVVRGGVGTGKSRIGLAYFFIHVCGGSLPINGRGTLKEFRTATNLYIITTAKKRDSKDWQEEALQFRLSEDEDLSFGAVKLTVDSWNNIDQYRDVKDAFFIFDEQRLVGSGSWVKAFIRIAQANRWILLSATPGDTWMDYIPVMVANGYYKNRTEFLRRHVVYNSFTKFPSVDHYVETRHLEKLRDEILVEVPYIPHTKRHVNQINVSHDKAAFELVVKKRWHVYEDRPVKDISELFIVMRKVVNSDPSRIGAVMQLMEKHPRLIIFYNFNYELDILRTLCNTTGVQYAEWNGHKHDAIPEGDSWIYLVQYTAGSEGWNCTTTDAVVFWSLNYSYKIYEQAQGRIDRLNTPYVDLYYYVLRSQATIDQAILRALAGKRKFNERDMIIHAESRFGNRGEQGDVGSSVQYAA